MQRFFREIPNSLHWEPCDFKATDPNYAMLNELIRTIYNIIGLVGSSNSEHEENGRIHRMLFSDFCSVSFFFFYFQFLLKNRTVHGYRNYYFLSYQVKGVRGIAVLSVF